MKDPRLCILFPFWERVLDELNIAIKIILPYRSPLEVYHSMHKRNGFSIEKSLVLWSKHVLFAEFYSRPHLRVFTTYEKLLIEPETLLNDVAKTLQISYPNPPETQREFLKSFLEEGLRHSTEAAQFDFTVPAFVENANRLFLSIAESGVDPIILTKEFDQALHEYTCIARFMLNSDLHTEITKKIDSALKSQRLGRRIEKVVKKFYQ